MTDVNRAGSPYEQLKRSIIDGGLTPGFPLVEGTLAQAYGVSRTPIREALTRLEQDGLLERTERGLIVRERNIEEVLDIYEVRITLAGLAARLASQKRTELDLIRMKSRLEVLAQIAGAEIAEVLEANRAVHRAFWQASHNVPLAETMERLSHQIRSRRPVTVLTEPGHLEHTIEQYRELITAIEAKDSDRASETAMRHFIESRDLRFAIWAQSQV